MTEIIRLHAVEGIARKSGTDEAGIMWIEVDAFADQWPGECGICGAEITSGWLCLDGGDEACSDHVVISEEARS
jgi:hypothetical protein